MADKDKNRINNSKLQNNDDKLNENRLFEGKQTEGRLKKKICVIGLGYIGLPTAAMFATHGHIILGVDVNQAVVDSLNQGKIIIEEPYLDILVQAAVTSGNLTASTVPNQADVFIICVPTPINPDKTSDMTFVRKATESIVPFLREGNIVILESTSPPGTVRELMLPILEKSGLKPGSQLFVAHSPERVLPGRILIELVENNRIVGGIDTASSEAVRDLYRTFVKGEIYLTDTATAEMCKLMENTYRDVNIALANELAMMCEQLGISAWEVISLSNRHPRVNLHQPGPGVGGHCIAVDPWFIVEKCPETAKIINLCREINDNMPHFVLDKIRHILGGINGGTNVNGDTNVKVAQFAKVSEVAKVTVLGVTYKPNVDDMRESPIIELLHLMDQESSFQVSVYDPHIRDCPHLEKDLLRAVDGASLLLLAVNHNEFRDIDFERIKSVMANPVVLDTRNFWNRDKLVAAGFEYHLLGSGK
ncbi:MAG: nucleotide sugar dehydrogenase [Clostridiales bacterium]|nr:nucleotide sugar dehydrogenase [Clostridiales bacterium]